MRGEAVTADEISASEIFRRLWEGRGIILIVPALLAGVAALFVILTALNSSRSVTYLIDLKNIAEQKYPNGSAFSPQDLLISDVLSELRTRFKLAGNVDIRRAVKVNYDSPTVAGLTKAYHDRLTARNLTQVEVAAINDAYKAELQAATKSSLRITVDYRALDVDHEAGLAIARAVPEIWARIYTKQFRIFTDTHLAENAVTRTREDLTTTSSILVASTRISAIESGLDTLLADNRLALLRAAEGTTPADLKQDVRRYMTIFLQPIMTTGLNQSGDVVANAYVTQLKMDIADMTRRVAAYDDSLKEIRDYLRPPPDRSQTAAGNPIEIDKTALSEILLLAQQASFTTFVQETLKSRNKLLFDISQLTKEMEIATSEAGVVTNSQFRAMAAAGLEELTTQYVQLLEAARAQIVNHSGVLYEPILGPLIPVAILTFANLLVILAGALAGVLLAVISVLIRPLSEQAFSRSSSHVLEAIPTAAVEAMPPAPMKVRS